MPYRIIFSIDQCGDIHKLAKFTRHLDTQRALGYLKGGIATGCGEWEGQAEIIFNLDVKDFGKFVRGSEYIKDQVCVGEESKNRQLDKYLQKNTK